MTVCSLSSHTPSESICLVLSLIIFPYSPVVVRAIRSVIQGSSFHQSHLLEERIVRLTADAEYYCAYLDQDRVYEEDRHRLGRLLDKEYGQEMAATKVSARFSAPTPSVLVQLLTALWHSVSLRELRPVAGQPRQARQLPFHTGIGPSQIQSHRADLRSCRFQAVSLHSLLASLVSCK